MSPILDLHEDRDPRIDAMLLGHVRLGIFPQGGKAPVQSDTFIFTSTDRTRLEPLARDFGGEVAQYQPQGAGRDSWRLISESNAFTALFPFPDAERNVAQSWEMWGRGGIKRRCTGFECSLFEVEEETGEITEDQAPCLCREANKRECDPITRVRLLLPQTGWGIWELRTGSKIAAIHLYDQGQFIGAIAPERMNHLPIRVVYEPREIAYFDEKEGKRRKTTKRVVALKIARDAQTALAPLGYDHDRGLVEAVRLALEDGKGRPELSPGANVAAHAETPEEPEGGEPHEPRKGKGTPRPNPPKRYAAALKEAEEAGIGAQPAIRVARKGKHPWPPKAGETTDEQYEAFAEALEHAVAEANQGTLTP